MLLGYNTNGFAHHDLLESLDVLAEIGYRSVALTLDHHALNPYSAEYPVQLEQVAERLRRHELRSVIETGARYLLDARRKHEPTLMHPDPTQRARRIDFLRRAIDVARVLGSDCVSLWSGVLRDDVSTGQAWTRLVDGLRPVVEHAAEGGVLLGFEPEPGMFVDTLEQYQQLLERLDAPTLQLTMDVGHLHCQGEVPIPDHVHRWRSRIVNVHLEDMRRGVHEHLMLGDGEMDFPKILQAFQEIAYRGGLHIELSRHSHDAPSAARRAHEFLSSCLEAIAASGCGPSRGSTRQ